MSTCTLSTILATLYNWYFRKGTPTAPEGRFGFWQLHHFFWGLIPLSIGFYGIFNWSLWISVPLLVLGLWLMVDDIAQHIIQKVEIEYYGEYTRRSFWNWFPGELGLYKLAGKLGIKT